MAIADETPVKLATLGSWPAQVFHASRSFRPPSLPNLLRPVSQVLLPPQFLPPENRSG